ncbi:MAG: family 78 glycoside hydrolase catalytic domain [Clostridia bacterium]|nr:family 78 glycoside hydrolase catalytic domain [Clostridia bacterium]
MKSDFIQEQQKAVFGKADWLTFADETEAIIARKDFSVSELKNTLLTVTGLGFCEVYINGKAVSDRLFAPAWTNYLPLDTPNMNYPIYDTMTYRILYEEIDITPFIKAGQNTLTFHLGGGWFCQHENYNEGVKPYGKLTLCFNISQNKNCIAKSDETLKWKKSFITRQNIYFGEKQDLRKGGYDFSDLSDRSDEWQNADIIETPQSILTLQSCPEDKIIRTVNPKIIFEKSDYAIYDLGENLTGYPLVEFNGTKADEIITLRFAEELYPDGSLNFDSTGGDESIQEEEYIFDGRAKNAHQHFTWHACRYFDVKGKAQVKKFYVVHTDLKVKAKFKSSEPVLQWIYDSFIRTQLNNSHCSIPSDCPHRERLGYTGDGQLTSNAVMDCFEADSFYRKWMQDITDSQDINNGHVQHTAPFYGGGGGPGGWGGAIVFVPYNHYKHYGDKTVLERYYGNMLSYLDYMESRSENGLVVREEKGGWCLGDWCSPQNRNLIPEEFVNTYFFLKAINRVIEISLLLGKDTAELYAEKKKVTSAFLKAFFDESKGTFCNSIEASDAFGFDLGLGDERTLKSIVKKYTALGEFDCGIFGTNILISVLCENGYKALAKSLLTSKKENTYYNMMKHGATTLWENWDGSYSHDHPMFGSVVECLLKYFNEY